MKSPGFFIQASNGALIGILIWMLIFSWLYLIGRWRLHNKKIANVYYVSKMAIAMAVFLFGFLLDRISAAIWMKNIAPGGHWTLNIDSIPMGMLLAGALVAILGGSCWIRVLSPERGPLCSWPAVMCSSVAFGCLIALI